MELTQPAIQKVWWGIKMSFGYPITHSMVAPITGMTTLSSIGQGSTSISMAQAEARSLVDREKDENGNDTRIQAAIPANVPSSDLPNILMVPNFIPTMAATGSPTCKNNSDNTTISRGKRIPSTATVTKVHDAPVSLPFSSCSFSMGSNHLAKIFFINPSRFLLNSMITDIILTITKNVTNDSLV